MKLPLWHSTHWPKGSGHWHGPSVRRRMPVFICGVVLTCTCAFLTLLRPQALAELEGLAYDTVIRQLPPETAPSQVVVIEIDERSLAEHGQWPWPRYKLAALIDGLRQAGVRGIGVDIVFAEPDRNSIDALLSTLQQDWGPEVVLELQGPVPQDNDALLAASIARAPVALALWHSGQKGSALAGGCADIAQTFLIRRTPDAPATLPVPAVKNLLCPISPLAEAAPGLGFVDAMPDIDGKIRRAPLLLRAGSTIYPSLALATLLQGRDAPEAVFMQSAAGLEHVTLGGARTDLDANGAVLLPYHPQELFRLATISATDVMAKPDTLSLGGKYAMVGLTGGGMLDTHTTPLERDTPGVYLHALLADALLRGDAYATFPWAHALQVLLTITYGLAATLLITFARPNVGAVLSTLLLVLTLACAYALFRFQSVAFMPVAPALTLLLAIALLGTVRHRISEHYTLERVRELAASQECALRGFASVAETRDPETGEHILRTQRFVRCLANELRAQPEHKRALGDDNLHLIVQSAPLHDIGKVSVPDSILLKPGKLTEAEFEIMKQHARAGFEVLRRARGTDEFSASLSFLDYAEQMALTHHEKWDGNGYPFGLTGDKIPLAGRIMALADVYDALRSKRVYKPAFSHETAKAIILEGRGSHFDPQVVDAFLACEKHFAEIWDEYPDTVLPAVYAVDPSVFAPVRSTEPCPDRVV